jgi:bifunctional non-homologous end joining protein LigD
MNNSAASRTHHPSRQSRKRPVSRARRLSIPAEGDEVELHGGAGTVRLTHLQKEFWSDPKITKGDLLRYYSSVAKILLPHLRDRAMVMKRYPNGIAGEFFFMKRAPSPRPDWIEVCSIAHGSGNVIDFPIIQNLESLLWVVNRGCIDLNPWYARCDDVDRPDYLHFDLDPVPGADFKRVRETALVVRDTLAALGMTSLPKTTGSRGIHVYVPIIRGPPQKQVWAVAKQIALTLEQRFPKLITAEYRIAKRPRDRVLVDYNQNAWGRTLASVYSVRPRPLATVSAPMTWREIERGAAIEDFRIDNMHARIAKLGDLWKPLLAARGRFRLETLFHPAAGRD